MQLLDQQIDRIKGLPPAPRILVQLLELLREESVDTDRIVELIKFDPALTAKVIQRSNSAADGLSEPTCDLAQAVLHVGFNEIYRIVAAVVGETTLGAAQRGYGIAPGELWEHSVASAIAARILALRLGGDENLAFTAGLLHDIGKLVLSSSLEDKYAVVFTATEQSGKSLLEVERMLLGVDHGAVGGRLLQRWTFPENLVFAVWHHHEPIAAGRFKELASCVHIGNVAAHVVGHGYGHQAHALRAHAQALEVLKMTPVDFERMIVSTEEGLEAMPWFQRRLS